ncbi:MAG: hypothetical protein JXB04_03505 [Kiritimatiellae bacterium]|nr:hypothetical protein [Kiritimatiellia bacterium]
MNRIRPILYYVSAHGYGHGVRSCDIIRALNRLYPDVPVILTSDLPASFLKNRLGSDATTLRAGCFDVGMVQLDSIRVDVAATLTAVEALMARMAELERAEAEFLRQCGAAVVVADIPSLPIAVGKALGLPALAAGNFSWDWIYSDLTKYDRRWEPIVERFARGYRQADLLLRFPFAGDMSVFPRAEDIPVVASPGRDRRLEIAERLRCDAGKTWVLLSFTSLDWGDAALDNVERLDGYEFFTVLPLAWKRRNIHAVDRAAFPFSDVLASADIVITKPGFGIVSECIVNRKPIVYSERTDFVEYPVLVQGIERYTKKVHLPGVKLYRGELREALDAVRGAPEPLEVMPSGGDEIAARRIMDFYRRD